MLSKLINKKSLVLLTLLTYLLSYFYLAFYHENWNLWFEIVHESGKYTLVETIFFASHFLGHIPIYTCLAIYFVGSMLCLTEVQSAPRFKSRNILIFLIIFLVICLVIALINSVEDTFAFIFQMRQRPGQYNAGGAWNLHLPSTLQMFLLIPIYQIVFLKLFSQPLKFSKRGINLLILAVAICFFFTIVVNSSANSFLNLFFDARYQGHALRELATYGLTYLPLALFFTLGKKSEAKFMDLRIKIVFYFLFGVLFLSVIYQLLIVLATDLKNITQVPGFSKSEHLSIAYLLSSHYFEHVLDSIYFVLIVLLVFNWKLSGTYSRQT